MKKLSLDPGALRVESFVAAAPDEMRATVQALQVTPDPDCQFSYDYGSTCPSTCAQTCGSTCGHLCTAGPGCIDPE